LGAGWVFCMGALVARQGRTQRGSDPSRGRCRITLRGGEGSDPRH
jgi:hypothetical protein